jgi:hypothetical protein
MLQLTRAGCLEKVFSTPANAARCFARNFFSRYTNQIQSWALPVALTMSVSCLASETGGLGEIHPNQMLRLIKRQEGSIIRFYVQNLEAADVTATFDLQLHNLRGNTNFPFTSTFPPKQTTEAFCLAPIHNDGEWHYTLTNYFTLGSNRAVHDDRVVYALPYAPGQAYRVSQAYDGSFSHTGAEKYAIDWKMSERTPVIAARGGVVVSVKDDSDAHGETRRFERAANYVLIQHSDGTIGNYAHLLKGGVKVKVGQSVQTGDLIALSGNTGFSSGPHLHFCVFKTRNGKERESIPVLFRTQNGPATLVCGQTYLAPKTLLAMRDVPSQEGSNEPPKVQFRSLSYERAIRSSPIERR